MLLSVILPVRDEAGNISPLAARLSAAAEGLADLEFIFIDDGSADGSLEAIRKLAAADQRVGFVSFTRNFGHQNALRAGLERARGDAVLMMDTDLQHPPELLPDMLARLAQGFDIVQAVRQATPEGWRKKAGSALFYRMLDALGDLRVPAGASDFRLLSSRAASLLRALPERDLFLRGAVAWTGLPTALIPYRAAHRASGRTKYSFARMLALAADGITSFSIRPLRLTAALGAAISMAAFAYAAYALAMRLFTDRTVEGWTSILISVLLVGGIQLVSIGVLGEYLGKLFMQSKGRPQYVVREESAPRRPGQPARGGGA